eukprot:365155-Chlamydomonas_euryale.AAC.4
MHTNHDASSVNGTDYNTVWSRWTLSIDGTVSSSPRANVALRSKLCFLCILCGKVHPQASPVGLHTARRIQRHGEDGWSPLWRNCLRLAGRLPGLAQPGQQDKAQALNPHWQAFLKP